jgi:hypothetical protein
MPRGEQWLIWVGVQGLAVSGGGRVGEGLHVTAGMSSGTPDSGSASGHTRTSFFSVRVVNVDYYLLDLDPWRPHHRNRYGHFCQLMLGPWAGYKVSGPDGRHLLWHRLRSGGVRPARLLMTDPQVRVPVVRIYGATPMGQKTCLHLHGAAPYFMIRPAVPPGDDPPPDSWSRLESIQSQLKDLEGAIEAAVRLVREEQSGGRAGPRVKVVQSLEVVRGTPMYGYRAQEQLFVRVTLFDPRQAQKVVGMLQSGAILGTAFQPFEAHIPFLLQFFVDHNVVGMGYLHLSNGHDSLRFRGPLPEATDLDELEAPPVPTEVCQLPLPRISVDRTALSKPLRSHRWMCGTVCGCAPTPTPRWWKGTSMPICACYART